MWREEKGRILNRRFSSTKKSYRPRGSVDFTTMEGESLLKIYATIIDFYTVFEYFIQI